MSDPLETMFAAMERTGIPVAKFAWATQPEPPWLVVSRTGDGGSLWSDSTLTDEVQEGTVDLFTREASAEHMRTVQDALKWANLFVTTTGNVDIITAEDMAKIDALDTGKTLFLDHSKGSTVEMFVGWSK